jgi:glycosyltransferase involved in cell wall biosynthesis
VRIGLLTQWYDPEPGPASLPGVLARGLVARGHDVEVLTGFPNYPTGRVAAGYRHRSPSTEVVEGVVVHRVPLYPSHDASTRGRLANYGSFAATAAVIGVPRLRRLDALWVYNSPATVAAPMWLLRHLRRVPVVLHNMDMWPDSVVAAGFAPTGRLGQGVEAGLAAWCRQMYRSSSYIAYTSRSAGVELAQRGVPERKLSYVPLWTDESVFRPSETDRRAELGIPADRVVVMYAGALGRAQGVEALLTAVHSLPADIPLTLLVAGSGASEDAVRRAADADPARVRFLGRLPQPEMTPYMATGDLHYVGLAPGPLARFTMPSKIQATMASGRGMLMAAGGDPERIVHDAAAGIPADPGRQGSLAAALREAVRLGRPVLAEMGRRSRAYYEAEFSVGRGVSRVEALLSAAAGRR